jgi:hypothetical protein
MGLNNSQPVNIKDAVLYAKNGNTFVKCGMSDAAGVYHLSSLPAGSLKIIVNRFGYSGDSTNVTVTSVSNTDSVNFHLYRPLVGINQIGTTVPSEYRLSQNYPNPFNPVTKIRFDIASAKQASLLVTLKVYDIMGREVQTLVNESLQPGTYETTFDGSLLGGLTSGVYFYKLNIGDFKSVKKMVMLK